jgi:predicted CoA-binding protein
MASVVTLDRNIAWDLLDAQEGTGPVPLLEGDEPARLLGATRRIAMVGASPDPGRPSHGVMRQLLDAGYDVVPVNPTVESVLDRTAYPTLEDAVAATGKIDMVDVFRRPEYTPDIARSAVAVGARSLWLQLGVVNWEAAQIAHDGGLDVVMDRCTAIEQRRLRFLGADRTDFA